MHAYIAILTELQILQLNKMIYIAHYLFKIVNFLNSYLIKMFFKIIIISF